MVSGEEFTIHHPKETMPIPKHVIANLHSRYHDVYDIALKQLEEIGNSQAIELLIERLASYDEHLRMKIAHILVRLEKRAFDSLVKRLDDEDPMIRQMVVWILGDAKESRVFSKLEELKDSDPAVRRQTMWALWKIDPNRAAEGIYSAMGDEDLKVRSHAIRLLENYPNLHSIELLIGCLTDDSYDTRTRVFRTLTKIAEKGIDVDLKIIQKMLHEFVKKQPREKKLAAKKEAVKFYGFIENAVRKGRGKIQEGKLSEGVPKAPKRQGKRMLRQRRSLNG